MKEFDGTFCGAVTKILFGNVLYRLSFSLSFRKNLSDIFNYRKKSFLCGLTDENLLRFFNEFFIFFFLPWPGFCYLHGRDYLFMKTVCMSVIVFVKNLFTVFFLGHLMAKKDLTMALHYKISISQNFLRPFLLGQRPEIL